MFSKTLPDLEKAIEDFRDRATQAMGSGESDYLPKLEDCTRFLRRQLAVSHPGDPAVSWLITKTVPTRNATTSYYSSISLRAAQRYQAAAVAETDNRAADVGSSVTPEPDLPAVLADRVIGSRFCPSERALTGLREHLLVKARISRGAMTPRRASEVDHAFTAYAWLFFSLHSGWRPPRKLLPDPEHLDWATGTFFLEDKLVHSSTAPTDTAGARRGSSYSPSWKAKM
ncbi:hypothetical protein GVO57_14140 (plasmid) [Sphingomonas changnyeongensis]|uniref:Uncharacterized protein n=1 Tax=Sphingomonas changnyeongensis TaxID=2698679 RepID=A0A7Z2NZB5_9SPHN|nr:hypothetical protein GVO57_14140 [Sphingomonas changnyeongensis]